MKRILVAWIGQTDLRAVNEHDSIGLGPIAGAVSARQYSSICLLSNYSRKQNKSFLDWISEQTDAPTKSKTVQLTSPTAFSEIHTAAVNWISEIQGEFPNTPLTFHLSPGTPAMAAVWIILAKTRFPAELIESSREQGVRTVTIPFDISAEFLPEMIRESDERLLSATVSKALEHAVFGDIIYRSPQMKRVIDKAKKVAPRSLPVLIQGESGTGKELLARAIHQESLVRNKKFVPVNCGAIPSELIEAELFGHEKGAFTGADRKRIGYFEEADGGTLFLDEIGELPKQAQVKLLRVLQEKRFTPVGSSTEKKTDFRVIAATNRDLMQEVAEGRFRLDLFHRLAIAILTLPPLRKRQGDLNPLIDFWLDRINEESRGDHFTEDKIISAGARNIIHQQAWHGNVRELGNTLRRAAVWSEGDTITKQDIEESLSQIRTVGQSGVLDYPIESGLNIQELIATVARHYLERALDHTHRNKTQAAELLGLANYQTLTNWMKKYGVK